MVRVALSFTVLLSLVGCERKSDRAAERKTTQSPAGRQTNGPAAAPSSRATGALASSGELDALFDELIRRKHWKRIRPELLRRVFDNSRGDVQAIRDFVFVAEQKDYVQESLLEGNLVSVATDRELEGFGVLSLFSLSFYQLGSGYCKMCASAQAEEEINHLGSLADKAFRSSILCNRFDLSSHGALAFLHGAVLGDPEVGLKWCSEARKAEAALRETPADRLSYYQLAHKKLLDPAEAARAEQKMREYAPHLLPDDEPTGEQTFADVINELEQELLRQIKGRAD